MLDPYREFKKNWVGSLSFQVPPKSKVALIEVCSRPGGSKFTLGCLYPLTSVGSVSEFGCFGVLVGGRVEVQFCIFILLLVVFSLRLPNAKPRQFALWLSSSFAVILSWCSFKLAGCARCRNGRGGGTPAHVLPQAVVQGVRHAEARPGSGALVGGERGQRGGPVAGQLQRWRAGNAFRAKLFS